jgi:hypothetical protein
MFNFSGTPKTNSLNRAEHEILMGYLSKKRCNINAMVEFLLESKDDLDNKIGMKLYKENEKYFNSGGFRICLN